MSKQNLSERQRRFVEAYMGEAGGVATRAAEIAGYAHPHVQGARLLANDRIAAAIAERQDNDPAVATRQERQAFWTRVMRGEQTITINGAEKILPVEMKDRLRASELLGKTGGDFGPKGTEDDPMHHRHTVDQLADLASRLDALTDDG